MTVLTVGEEEVALQSLKGWAELVPLWGERLGCLVTLLVRTGVWLCHWKYLPA